MGGDKLKSPLPSHQKQHSTVLGHPLPWSCGWSASHSVSAGGCPTVEDRLWSSGCWELGHHGPGSLAGCCPPQAPPAGRRVLLVGQGPLHRVTSKEGSAGKSFWRFDSHTHRQSPAKPLPSGTVCDQCTGNTNSRAWALSQRTTVAAWN